MKKSLGPKTIIYPTPVLIVGSYDAGRRPNIMAASWGGICCSEPPCVYVSLREATHTYDNITESGAYTINIPSVDQIKQADYAGIASGENENKFEKLGLTPVKAESVRAPYIEEFPLVLECEVLQTVPLGLHTQFVGEVKDVQADESVLDDKGHIVIEKLRPFFFAPPDRAYYATGERLGEAFSIGRM